MCSKKVVRTFIEEAFNKGNLSILNSIIHKEYKFSSTDTQMHGIDQLKVFIESFRAAFPDLKLSIDDIFSSVDKVCTSFTMVGTHEKEFMGIPSTQKTVEVKGVVISKFQDGQIVEECEILDNLSLLQQLGVISCEAVP